MSKNNIKSFQFTSLMSKTKWFVCLLGLFISSYFSAQIQDNFSDGNFNLNPIWNAATIADFTVVSEQLKSAKTISNTSFYISTNNTLALNCQWEFYVNLQFNTSSANYINVFLISNQNNLLSNLNGYYVMVGSTQDDICLYKKTGATSVKIIDGLDGLLNISNSTLKIKVTRDVSDNWKLERDLTGTGNNYVSEGVAIDNTYTTTTSFGFVIQQSTASFMQKHIIDDVYVGPIIIDTQPPFIVSSIITNSSEIEVVFNEKIDLNSSQNPTNYSMNPNTTITQALRDGIDLKKIKIKFNSPFQSETAYTLIVSNIKDLNSNVMITQTFNLMYYKPKIYDIVFNEIMPDPDPQVFLPNAEYIELKNRSKYAINLKNWLLTSTSTIKSLPAIILPADSLIVLTSAPNSFLFASKNIKAYDVTDLPTLVNSGTTLSLRDSNGILIHTITYNLDWYNNSLKNDGGWSIEQIDDNNFCGGITNWKASTNVQGGTPGKINSVKAINIDKSNPELDRVEVLSLDSLQLHFNKSIDSLSLINPTNYIVENNFSQIKNVIPIAPQFNKVKLKLIAPIPTNLIYTITVSNSIKDCVGNPLNTINSALFAIPQQVNENDVVINEILFDPKTGSEEFVEIYNRSNKVIDLQQLYIGTFDTIAKQLTSTQKIMYTNCLLFPKQYIVLSSSQQKVKSYYSTPNPKNFIDVPSLASFNNTSDCIVLSDINSKVIDKINYRYTMHFPLLSSTKGVSLERINFERPSQDITNWNSAASIVGFATPAYQNSQYLKNIDYNEVQITNPIFSPDNDGYNDVLNISFKLDATNYMVNIDIYNSDGLMIKHLIKNEQCLQEAVYSWNGITDSNFKSPIGIYIAYLEFYNLSGVLKQYKLPFTLASKFN